MLTACGSSWEGAPPESAVYLPPSSPPNLHLAKQLQQHHHYTCNIKLFNSVVAAAVA